MIQIKINTTTTNKRNIQKVRVKSKVLLELKAKYLDISQVSDFD